MELINDPGNYNITLEEYHGNPCIEPCLSTSVIKDLLYKSPAHAFFNHPVLNKGFLPEPKPERFDLGSATHSLFLEGIDIAVLIPGDDWRKKEAKEARDKAREEGKIPFLVDQYEKVIKMVKVANKAISDCDELKLGSLKLQGDSELSCFWQEEDIWLKVRPDWINENKSIILDYKTTNHSANPEELARIIVSMGYDIQDALYTRGIKAIEGIEPKFLFLFQEIYEPYLCSIVGLPPGFMEMANQKVDYGIFLWRECLSTGKWPGYPDQIAWIEPPAWALTAWESRAQGLGIGGDNGISL